MPRGVKKAVDLDAQIQQIDAKLLDLEEQKKKLEEQKASLFQKKKEESSQKLLEFLSVHNLSPAEAIESLTAAVAASSNPNTELV